MQAVVGRATPAQPHALERPVAGAAHSSRAPCTWRAVRGSCCSGSGAAAAGSGALLPGSRLVVQSGVGPGVADCIALERDGLRAVGQLRVVRKDRLGQQRNEVACRAQGGEGRTVGTCQAAPRWHPCPALPCPGLCAVHSAAPRGGPSPASARHRAAHQSSSRRPGTEGGSGTVGSGRKTAAGHPGCRRWCWRRLRPGGAGRGTGLPPGTCSPDSALGLPAAAAAPLQGGGAQLGAATCHLPPLPLPRARKPQAGPHPRYGLSRFACWWRSR